MGKNLTYKILEKHLVSGKLVEGEKIGIKIDQTLTQDATGTMAFLEYEAIGASKVKTELSVSYVDHNMMQIGPENQNDHQYLQSVAQKTGVYFSRAGNGICHQVHLERFSRPGRTLLGSDSHTPTSGGNGMLAIGAGGFNVALAMAGEPFPMTAPKVVGVKLTGKLQPWVAAKDIILRVLSILSTKGNVGCIVEYFGEGVSSLSVPERGTVTNMGAELGATTSIFPADEKSKAYLTAQGREDQYEPASADADAKYSHIVKWLHPEKDATFIENIRRYCPGAQINENEKNSDGAIQVEFDEIHIDLNELEPLAAQPGSPDRVIEVRKIAGMTVGQVIVGSCTNSSYHDLMTVSTALKNKSVHPGVSFAIAPGSKQVYTMIAKNGGLGDLIASGARILESACGPCIGQGQSPGSGVVSLRSFNRNFVGRSGTSNDNVYLVSPETAAAAALTGKITDPRDIGEYPNIEWPEKFLVDDSMIIAPKDDPVEVIRRDTIGSPPDNQPLPANISGLVLLKAGDKVTTDHIMPAGEWLKYRSNIPAYSRAVFVNVDSTGHERGKEGFDAGEPSFHDRALAVKKTGKHGIIVGRDSYAQGSSREHAAICPMYLGVKVVLALAIERIHRDNLVNFGIVPLLFKSETDYDGITSGDNLSIDDIRNQLKPGHDVHVINPITTKDFYASHNLTQTEIDWVLAGGRLSFIAASKN
ncbi:MAG: aconitate hydratase [Planctomycetes bacterium]|nr:aconitate hydratase [Planctomycetota bacterium]